MIHHLYFAQGSFRAGGIDWIAEPAAGASIGRSGAGGRVRSGPRGTGGGSAWSRVARKLSGAGDSEAEGLGGLSVASDVGLRGGFFGDGVIAGGAGCLECHALRHHDGQGVGGKRDLGIKLERAGVGEVVGELEAGFAGADGEDDGVVVGIAEWDGRCLDGHGPGTEGRGAFNDGASRKVKLKCVIAELGARWVGVVFDEEVLNHLENLAGFVSLETNDGGFTGDAFDLCGGVIHVDVDGPGARGRGAEVVRLIVGDADEVDACVRDLEREAAAAIGLGARAFLHALRELDQDDIVAGCGFVGGFVGDDAGDGFGGEGDEGAEQEQGEGACGAGQKGGWTAHIISVAPRGEELVSSG